MTIQYQIKTVREVMADLAHQAQHEKDPETKELFMAWVKGLEDVRRTLVRVEEYQVAQKNLLEA